jgi:hypothetical protein
VPWLPENPSLLAVLVGLVAIGTFAYTLFRDLFPRSHTKLFLGDTVGIVCSASGARKIHLRLSVINVGRRAGVLTFARACLRDQRGSCRQRHFHWKLFWRTVAGAEAVEKEDDCYPVPIRAGQAISLGLELESPEDQREVLLSSEQQVIVLETWMDREAIDENHTESVRGTFTADRKDLEFALKGESPRVCRYRRAEWRERRRLPIP